MSAAVGTIPPEPRLVRIPDHRVCTCGKILTPAERAEGSCLTCQILNRHLPKLPIPAAAALS